MDVKQFQDMLDILKDESMKKINMDNAALKEEIKAGNDKIHYEVKDLKNTVDENTEVISSISHRIEVLESKTNARVSEENIPLEKNVANHMKIKHVLNMANNESRTISYQFGRPYQSHFHKESQT